MLNLRLIVNADDYGRTPGVSRGIRKAHLEGIVTSTTALMNMPGVEAALDEALRLCPRLGLGVHLVVTSGSPVLSPSRVLSLTDGGTMFPLNQAERIAQMDLAELHDEWHAQLERFIRVTDRTPDHLDCHHHFSYFSEAIFRIMLDLAGEFECAVRNPLSTRLPGETGGLPNHFYAQAQGFVPQLLEEYSIRHPDHFEGTFYDENATFEQLSEILNNLQSGTSELMCHPGYADMALLDKLGSSYNVARESELALLTDPRILELVVQRGIRLISYTSL